MPGFVSQLIKAAWLSVHQGEIKCGKNTTGDSLFRKQYFIFPPNQSFNQAGTPCKFPLLIPSNGVQCLSPRGSYLAISKYAPGDP